MLQIGGGLRVSWLMSAQQTEVIAYGKLRYFIGVLVLDKIVGVGFRLDDIGDPIKESAFEGPAPGSSPANPDAGPRVGLAFQDIAKLLLLFQIGAKGREITRASGFIRNALGSHVEPDLHPDCRIESMLVG